MPNTLAELNQYSNTSVIYTDDRAYSITFSANAASNTSTTIDEDDSFVVPTGIDITSVFSQPGNITYTINSSTANIVGTWPSPLPQGISNTSPGNGVYSITGIFDVTNWNLTKGLVVVAPDRDAPFTFVGNIQYPNPANVAQTSSWSWTNSVTIANTNPELSLTTSYTWAEDAPTTFVYSVDDLDPTATYTLTFDQFSGTSGIITVNGVSPGVGNTATVSGNRSAVNSTAVVFNPYPDATDNVQVYVSAVKSNPFGNVTFANNTVTTLNCTSTHNEYEFLSSQYRSNNVDRLNFQITDLAEQGTYTILIQDVTASLGRFYYNNAWQSNNSVTVTGNKSQVNSSVVWYEPSDDYTGNVNLQYSQSKVVSGYPSPIIQANADPFTLTAFTQFTLTDSYSFGNTTTVPVELNQTLISGGNAFPETALYNVTFAQASPGPTSNTAPSWATGTEPPANVTTWTSRTSGYSAVLSDTAYNGNLYVVVGSSSGTSGTVRTSTNLTTWTETATPANGLTGLIWDGNQFVACGAQGITTSPDATTWTSRTSSSIEKLVWNGSLYVGVGGDNLITTSSDSVTWTPRTSSASFTFRDVAWGGGLFVAVGFTGSGSTPCIIRTSPNGVDWTDRTPSTTSTLLSGVAWTGTQFVAVGSIESGPSVIMTSPDGIAWTTRYSDSDLILSSVAFTTGQIIVSGGVVGSNTLLTSSDGGSNWTSTSLGANFINQLRNTGTVLFATGGSGYLATRGSDSDIAGASYTIPANSIVGINALTDTLPLRYYRNATVTGNTIILDYNLAKTRTDAGHPYQNQSRAVVTDVPITLTKT